MTVEGWQDWIPGRYASEQQRTCSVPGCKQKPVRLRVQLTPGTSMGQRRWVYCADHVQEAEKSRLPRSSRTRR